MEIEKSELIKRFSLLERAIPGRPTIPCTEGILVKDGRMSTKTCKTPFRFWPRRRRLKVSSFPKRPSPW